MPVDYTRNVTIMILKAFRARFDDSLETKSFSIRTLGGFIFSDLILSNVET